ncbi:sensor histidine kinase [Nocardioides litoris]|uniref:sensor histidine kinase n=1 Tax=Nocardioides litoris TaxID=1926648 RepID=UPI00111D071C|nr:histidine kinase [Nocardioides litoris]
MRPAPPRPTEVFTGVVLGAVALLEVRERLDGESSQVAAAVVAAAVVVAATTVRRQPAVALALVWAAAVLQVATATPLLAVEVAAALVAYGCARWGGRATLALSALSIPAVSVTAVVFVLNLSYEPFTDRATASALYDLASRYGGGRVTVVLAAVALLVLAVPWLAGLAVRLAVRADRSERSEAAAQERASAAQEETESAREIARLREDQARLARDVHDVVGHSLAVILAQAESAQYLPDDDPARLKKTMETIATSARTSLQDVRQVLSSPDTPPAARPLDTLVDGVRAGGHQVVVSERGTARPLPPDLEVTAYRVLQEMLTNAVKHGRRDGAVRVERHWPDSEGTGELRIEVRNPAESTEETRMIAVGGTGIEGMRHRLASVGGRLETATGADTFTATASIPLGPR